MTKHKQEKKSIFPCARLTYYIKHANMYHSTKGMTY